MKKMLLGGAALAALLVSDAARRAWPRPIEQKKDAEAVVEKNAQTIWDIGDSIYYFGEMGMQEFESTKLLKDTLEAAGFKVDLGVAGMPTALWATYGSGHPYIVIETEIDALPGGNQTPLDFEHKPMVPGRARPHGRPQHAWRRRHRRGLRGEAGDGEVPPARHRRRQFRPGRGRDRQPALHRQGGLFQGCRRRDLSSYRRQFQHRLGTAELRRDRRAIRLPRQDRPCRGRSLGRQERARCARADGQRGRLSCASR